MIETLEKLLAIAPVMGQFHPLWELCLPPDVEVASSAKQITERLDSLERHPERPILITEYVPIYADRFLVHHLPDCPPVELVNRTLSKRIASSHHLLTCKEAGHRIVNDTRKQRYETVILMLIDGLSYEDTRHWLYPTTPCLITGPSITFARTNSNAIIPDVGLPAIVGRYSIARQLTQVGLPHSRGYSYWERDQNDVSNFLFSGMPLQRVQGITDAIGLLKETNLKGMYVQIVREGTDGLAHRRREVTPSEVRVTVDAVLKDLQKLINLLAEKEHPAAVYLISDHGILWKHQHTFHRLPGENSAHARYSWERPLDTSYVSQLQTSNGPCYLYHYPHIGRQIPANDSGVHGGLSYWENVVPFVHVEVNL